MFQHGDIWRALDSLAASRGLSASALAKRAGLDPTTFNKSKRVTRDGKLRWPSTESVSKVLTAVNATTVEFVTHLGSAEPERRRRVPVIGYAMAGKDGYFDDAGYPAGSGWDEVAFPDLEDPHCYALEVTGDSMTPVYRDGDIIIVSPHGQLRRGDRVVAKTKSGEVLAKELVRQTPRQLELISLNPAHGERIIPANELAWVHRIVWASQ
ncbi:MAG: helix-turn-helix transcriptional regulator [Alphaproteobacteria bacterium]